MKVLKLFVLSIVLLVMVLIFSMQTDATLTTIGTATFNSSEDYNLIQFSYLIFCNSMEE
ncbi:MAG: hypothetical protein KAJ10_05005 [Thermodesulfovibrionia bacterium]|nr:hypothetical protein [Thermodesulfovibrionia bacterium]